VSIFAMRVERMIDRPLGRFLDGPGRRKAARGHVWNTECQCRTGAKCALVSADFLGWLATLHLRHFSAVSSRSCRGE
jgi:hypothetical protein